MSGTPQDNSIIELILLRIQSEQITRDDQAILIRLAETLNDVDRLYEAYEFNSVLHVIYHFFWTDFCDWYIEVSKPRMSNGEAKETCLAIQDICLRQILLLLHPFTPFITEELWFVLGFANGQSIQGFSPGKGADLINTLRKQGFELDPKSLDEVSRTRELIKHLRALKAERNLSNNRQVEFFYVTNPKDEASIKDRQASILTMAGASALKKADSTPSGLPACVTPLGSFFLDLSKGVDIKSERTRLHKEATTLEGMIRGIEAKLRNSSFVDKAPEQVVNGAKKQLSDNLHKLKEIKEALEAL